MTTISLLLSRILKPILQFAAFAILTALFVALALGAYISATGRAPELATPAQIQLGAPPAQTTMELALDAPKKVRVKEPIKIQFIVKDAQDLAGYETHLLFDTRAAELGGVTQRNNDLQKLGREPMPLVVAQLPDGAAFGAASCPFGDCVNPAGAKQKRGGQGKLHLATITIIPQKAGVLELKFDASKFVDADGKTIAVKIVNPSLTVKVGGKDNALTAPQNGWTLSNKESANAAGPFDLTGDGVVNYSDAAEVALEWQRTREASSPCANLPDATRDVNHDGCIDIADLQSVAARAETSRKKENAETVQAIFVVNTTSDDPDINPGDGICRTAQNNCSLRAAIRESNARSGPDTIHFNIPGGGVKTIQLYGNLQTLNDATGATTIDGYTQPTASPNTDALASNAQLKIQVRGRGPNNSDWDGITITSANNVVKGIAFFNLKRSFWITGAGAQNNTIVGNFIGTDAAGTFGYADTVLADAFGVSIQSGARSNRIGAAALADRNIISGNARSGVAVWHETTRENFIQNNIVGLNPGGAGGLPNRKHGLDVNYGSYSNVFGGSGAGERNVLSGNSDTGIEISHLEATANNQVIANFIGTDLTGTTAAAYTANAYTGVTLEDGASNNVIAENVIGNNAAGGVQITEWYTYGNQIYSNRIGVSASDAPIPNGQFGVKANGSWNWIAYNQIAYNTFAGVDVTDDAAQGNRVTQNAIFDNNGLGINLGAAGPNPNQPQCSATGPNNLLNYPLLASATSDGATTTIQGTLNCTASSAFTLEFFASPACDGSSYGEGAWFLGATDVTTDGAGNASFNVNFPIPTEQGTPITATNANANGDTSEFSPCVNVGGASPWTSVDINTAFAGTTDITGSSISVRGSGADIWGANDSFRYAYQNRSGDFTLSAKVTQWNGSSNPWSKGGLMLRNSTAANAAQAMVMVTGANGIRFQWRASNGGTTLSSTGPASFALPVWVRLQKTGNVVRAYWSPNGSTWNQLGAPTTINLTANYLYGVATTAHNNGAYARITMDTPTITGGSAPELANAKKSKGKLALARIETESSSSSPETWVAQVKFDVVTKKDRRITGATVIGVWDDGSEFECVSFDEGICIVTTENLPNEKASVSLTLKKIKYGDKTHKLKDEQYTITVGAP